ncbi:DUF438 domain-containing protein [candidate division KSB1 bacterium]
MTISENSKVHDLLQTYPFLEDFLVGYNPKFDMLKNRMARATIGRVATLRTVAGIANIDLAALLSDLAGEIEKKTGSKPEISEVAEAEGPSRQGRLETLKEIIQDLHDGGDLAAAQKRFAEAVTDVEASEIAAMEEELIRDGLPVAEVQRLCDVHVGAFRKVLDEHPEVQVLTGHPVHTYMEANKVIAELAEDLAAVAREIEAGGGDASEQLSRALQVLGRLRGVENHYQRKENQLFPILERHDITGPSKVMWGVHDEIRSQLKSILKAAEAGDLKTFAEQVPGLSRSLVEMIYKEEKILFPLALETLDDGEWLEIRTGEDSIGYVLAAPVSDWQPESVSGEESQTPAGEEQADAVPLDVGKLTPERLNLVLTHLPVDITYVDEEDRVQYYSETPHKIFSRSPAIIGRKVQNCHPPDSVHIVERILDEFKAGTKDVAEFWMNFFGKFVHIRYFAVRDKDGLYRGTIEVSQDITAIKGLEGERRLLDW